jgi:mono/diheme cytochrome c family protein
MKRLLFLILFAIACNRTETPRQPTAAAPAAPDPRVESGRAFVAQYGCTACHIVPGVEGGGALGPSLAGIGSRPTISYGAVQNTPANLAQYVQDPATLNPQASMPPINITDADAEAIAAFLMTLK